MDRNYTVRTVKKEEVEKLKLLAGDNGSFDKDDIWVEQSKVCVDDNDNVLGYALLKPNSLKEFFKNEIPADENVDDSIKWKNKEDIEYFENAQYEVFLYLKDDKNPAGPGDVYLDLIKGIEFDDTDMPIGVIWTPYNYEYNWHFYNFNNIVWVIIPIME